MLCKAEVKTERYRDDDRGEWLERYTLTIRADLVEGPDEYDLAPGTTPTVEAVDSEDNVEAWPWSFLNSRERDEAWGDLIADYQRQAPALKRCPHCRNVLEVANG